MRDSFIFYKSFYDCMKPLNEHQVYQLFKRLCEYALNDVDEPSDDAIVEAMFNLIRPQIDANNKRFEDGRKGGAPKGNTNAKKNKKQPVVDLKKQPKQPSVNFLKQPKQPNVNVNDNVNDNVNENVNANVETFGLFDDGVFHIGDFFKEQKN